MLLDLEKRLDNLDSIENRSILISDLNNREYNRTRLKFTADKKYTLTELIADKLDNFGKDGENISKKIKNTLNWAECLRVYWGLDTYQGHNPVINSIVEKLDDWETTMFFAGSWYNRKNRTIEEDIPLITYKTIKSGYKGIKKQHQIRIDNKRYTRQLHIPGEDNYFPKARSKESDSLIAMTGFDIRKIIAKIDQLKKEQENSPLFASMYDPKIEEQTTKFTEILNSEGGKLYQEKYGTSTIKDYLPTR